MTAMIHIFPMILCEISNPLCVWHLFWSAIAPNASCAPRYLLYQTLIRIPMGFALFIFDHFVCCSAFHLMSFVLGSNSIAIHRRHSDLCIAEGARGSVVGWIVYWRLVWRCTEKRRAGGIFMEGFRGWAQKLLLVMWEQPLYKSTECRSPNAILCWRQSRVCAECWSPKIFVLWQH